MKTVMNRAPNAYKPFILMAGCLLVALLAGFGFTANAVGATLRVPLDYSAIQKAVDAAKKGDKIQVSAGTYRENIIMKAGVTLEGGWNKDFSRRDASAYATIIDGSRKSGSVVCGANKATLDGFTIINATPVDPDSLTSGGIECLSTSPTIINNIIKANAPSGIYCNSSSAIIANNIISNNEEAGIYLEAGCSVKIRGNTIRENKKAGIDTEGTLSSRIDVRNNVIHNNGEGGMNVKAATGTICNNIIYENKFAGIVCAKTPIDIINNTIVANLQAGVALEDPSAIPTIKNNILAHNSDSGIKATDKGHFYNLLFSNNMTQGSDPDYLWCVRRQYGGYGDEESCRKFHDIMADPLFVDAANHDYHLQPASPAIDAGDPDSVYHDVHFPPSLGSSVNDMGAYGGPFSVKEERKSNDPPRASAGPSQEAYIGDKVTLDGSGSIDPNGDSISCLWRFVSRPEGSKAGLSDPKAVSPTFEADLCGDYVVQLVVKDRWGKASDPDTVKITALSNHPPVASAGEIIFDVSIGDTITLYGSGSNDPDGDLLEYRWELVFKPSASRTRLSDPGAVNPLLLIDAFGCYEVRLVVNDGKTDSIKDTVYVNTRHSKADRKRNVPGEYPTIQTAVDAASPGDDIVVRKGVYEENIVLDTPVNLIGIGWPVIDGGSKDGDINTIMIPYLGDKAGRVEGFIVTGGGKGPMGHGINVWDSAPVIRNNKICGNHHNGLGIHGRDVLTAKTRIHNNDIYENTIGIGNGRGSEARIYENRIYNNRMVGVGSRGLAAPRIERNHIHGNYIGIGAREVASPHIEGNHIHDNVCGVVISPVSTVRGFAGDAITIKNNLVFDNYQCGVSITSFNLSKVIISNNTIDSNNHRHAKEDRGGGLIFGYPFPASFTAVVENNIVTNNKLNGIENNVGTELFPMPGVTLITKNNNVWNNEEDYAGCSPGHKDFSKDPLFVPVAQERKGNFCLSQRASGQDSESPCVDAGSSTAANLGLQRSTTRTDNAGDTGMVDIGYHYVISE